MTQTTVALNSQWLDSSVQFSPAQCTDTFNGTTAALFVNLNGLDQTAVTYTYWPQYQPGIWWYPYEGPSRPIKLTLSEIARLKAAAKRDAKLKAILAKFTDQIELTVDFE